MHVAFVRGYAYYSFMSVYRCETPAPWDDEWSYLSKPTTDAPRGFTRVSADEAISKETVAYPSLKRKKAGTDETRYWNLTELPWQILQPRATMSSLCFRVGGGCRSRRLQEGVCVMQKKEAKTVES
jgi:hypothetical protein